MTQSNFKTNPVALAQVLVAKQLVSRLKLSFGFDETTCSLT